MNLKVPRPLAEPQDRPGTQGGEQARTVASSPYSPQYETIVAQGHERPAPSFGAPTLIWHVAFWPRRQTDYGYDCDPNDTAGMPDSGVAKRQFETRRKLWHDEINLLLTSLQEKSSRRPGQVAPAVKTFKRVYPHELKRAASPARGGYVTPLEVLEHDTLTFTLWWADATDADPLRHAIRVRTHAHLSSDYACLSFFMDIGQPWNETHSSTAMRGARRSRLLQAVRDVQELCEHQFVPAEGEAHSPVDLPPIPERMHSLDGRSQDALDRALREARNLLYVDAWEAFCEEFDFGLDKVAGARSEVFANFRGLVLSTQGMPSTAPRAGADTACVGTVPFPNFSADPRFNADGAEANAVAKAFWPFVRRITPRADYREFICCGVLNWRAIYITALGSSSQYVRGEERVASDVGTGEALIRVAPQLIPEEERSQVDASARVDDQVRARESLRGGNNHPVRYLLLTKHAPHPRQIGRIVERINAMATMRLFALKDWAAVRNADPYIRILGQDLDQITESWSTDKNLISALKTSSDIKAARLDVDKMRRRVTRGLSGRWTMSEMQRLEAILPSYIPRSPANRAYRAVQWVRLHLLWRRKDYFALVKQMDEDLAGDVRHSVLYHISSDIETRLLEISARLDELGKLTVGGLHFRLGRAAYYVREFETLLGTLQVTNIPTWVSYEQFVRRGLAPAFDYMASVGQRLRAVRERLLSVTEMIETSALVGQSAATRHNTAVLRQTTTLAIVLLTLYLARNVIWNAFALLLRPLYRSLPAGWRELIDPLLSIFQ